MICFFWIPACAGCGVTEGDLHTKVTSENPDQTANHCRYCADPDYQGAYRLHTWVHLICSTLQLQNRPTIINIPNFIETDFIPLPAVACLLCDL